MRCPAGTYIYCRQSYAPIQVSGSKMLERVVQPLRSQVMEELVGQNLTSTSLPKQLVSLTSRRCYHDFRFAMAQS